MFLLFQSREILLCFFLKLWQLKVVKTVSGGIQVLHLNAEDFWLVNIVLSPNMKNLSEV